MQRVRATRDDHAVEKTLGALEAGALGTDNLMPLLVECAKAYCTVGEMTTVLRSVFGDFNQPLVI